MVRLRISVLGSLVLAMFAVATSGQSASSQNVVSPDSSAGSPSERVAAHPTTDDSAVIDPATLLPDLPALRPAKASLIGGTVQKMDRVRDEITLQVFGGGKIKIFFDARTHILQESQPVDTGELRRGDRVYIDTILDGSMVFARSIRIKGASSVAGESQGTVVSYRSDSGELVLRDALSPSSLKIRVTPQTQVMDNGHPASAGELVAGTLISVKFGPQQKGSGVAQEISVLAVPGASFTFSGRVSALDLRLGLLVIDSSTDHKTYEVYFDPSLPGVDKLREATDVSVVTRFDGSKYMAQNLTVNSQ